MDPLQIWDFKSLITKFVPDQTKSILNSVDISKIKEDVSPQIQEIDKFVYLKHEKDLELDFKRLNADFECRIAIEKRNIKKAEENGQRFLIDSLEDNVNSLREKHQEVISERESSRIYNGMLPCHESGCIPKGVRAHMRANCRAEPE